MDNGGYKHRLVALLSADVTGYSRLMARKMKFGAIRTLTAYHAEMTALIQIQGGRVVNFVGASAALDRTNGVRKTSFEVIRISPDFTLEKYAKHKLIIEVFRCSLIYGFYTKICSEAACSKKPSRGCGMMAGYPVKCT